MTISLCMIVKNEEEVLVECLDSVKDVVSEIVAVDTGSTDRTLEILANYGAKVKQIPWTGNFAEARNASLTLATGNQILVLDADERLLSGRDSVLRFIQQYPHDSARIQVKNEIDGQISIHSMIRMFPNDSRFRFEGAIHESIMREGKRDIGKPSDISILHVGYGKERYEKRGKKSFYLGLYEQELLKEPQNGYLLYQIAKLHYSTEADQEAIPYFEQCLSLKEVDYLYFPVMLVMYGYCLKRMGHSQKAQDLLLDYMDQYSDFPDLFFLFGLLAMDTGVWENVRLAFSECLRIGETNKYASVEGVGSYKALHNLGVFYEVSGEVHEALQYYQEAATYGYEPSINRINILKK